jgi:4-amino-4-deoxy-L-arabinose transferase-like glycosyltransferase
MSSLPVDGRRPLSVWWAIGIVVAGFVIWSFAMLRGATLASWQDTEAYLGHALYIAEHGGFWGFLRDSFNGTFPIAERHPLYMLLLAPFASRTAEFFYTAKIIDLAFGLIVLMTLSWMVWRRYGRGPALIAAFLYAVSNSLVVASSHVNHEALFVLCTLWFWWFLTQPSRSEINATDSSEAVSMPSEMPNSVTRWAIAGMFLGLAYLVKSPASLIGVAAVLAGLWRGKWRFLVGPRLWILLVAVAIVSSPLAIRNIIGFGTPVYEGVNSNIMWIDRWTDIGAEHTSLYYDHYGIMKVERNGLPTASEYLQTHGIVKIGKRLVKGVITEVTRVAPKSVALFWPAGKFSYMWGVLVLVLAVAGWWLRRRSWEACLMFFWSALFAVFFGWDHMFPDIRYLAPLVPLWITFAAYATWRLLIQLATLRTAWRAVAVGISSAVLLLVGGTVVGGSLSREQPTVTITPAYASLIDWLNSHIEPMDRMVIGPSMDYYGLLWMVERPVLVVQTPTVDSLEAFQRYLRERKVRYLVLHRENAKGQGGRLAEALAPYVDVTADGTMIEKRPLPGWRAVYQDGTSPRFIVYEAEAAKTQRSNTTTPMTALSDGQVLWTSVRRWRKWNRTL